MGNVLLAIAAGFGPRLSLIVAVGPQNTFVLRQGIQRHAVPSIVAICALSDAVLIALGVAGVGTAVRAWPPALTIVGLGGGGFLLAYGVLAARRAYRPSAMRLTGGATGSRGRAVATCLAMTWLNPPVHLDPVDREG